MQYHSTDFGSPPGGDAPLHLIIYANPAPASFDAAIVDAYAGSVRDRGHRASVRDLYAIGFDPVLKLDERPRHGDWHPRADVVEELQHLRCADAIVLVYPIWYGTPPAILKGYVDRVLGSGYTFHDVHDRKGQTFLTGKPLVSFSTSGLPLSWLCEKGQALSLREIFDVYLWRGFGMRQSDHIMIENVVSNMSPDYANTQLERVRATARRTCALLDDAVALDQFEA